LPFSLLEPWEVMLLCTSGLAFVMVSADFPLQSVFSVLTITRLFKHLPQQLIFTRRRGVYYLWGHKGKETLI